MKHLCNLLVLMFVISCGEGVKQQIEELVPQQSENQNTNASIETTGESMEASNHGDRYDQKENTSKAFKDQEQSSIWFYLGAGVDGSECFVVSENLINCEKDGKVVATYSAKGEAGPKGADGLDAEPCNFDGYDLLCGENRFDLEQLRGPKGDQGAVGPEGQAGESITGPTGAAGAAGADGIDAIPLLSKTTSISGEGGCATGMKIEMGHDNNLNTILDTGEIDSSLTKYICNGSNGSNGSNGADGSDGESGGRTVLINGTHEWIFYPVEEQSWRQVHAVHAGTGDHTEINFPSSGSGPEFFSKPTTWGTNAGSDGYMYSDSSCTTQIGYWSSLYQFFRWGGSVLFVSDDSSKVWRSSSTYNNSAQYKWIDQNTNSVLDAGECYSLSDNGLYAVWNLDTMPTDGGSPILGVINSIEFQ